MKDLIDLAEILDRIIEKYDGTLETFKKCAKDLQELTLRVGMVRTRTRGTSMLRLCLLRAVSNEYYRITEIIERK